MWVKRPCNDGDTKCKIIDFERIGLNKHQLLKWLPSCIDKKASLQYGLNLLLKSRNLYKNDLLMKDCLKSNYFLLDFVQMAKDIWSVLMTHKLVKSGAMIENPSNVEPY